MFNGEGEVVEFEARLAARGVYTLRCDADRDRLLATDPVAKRIEFEHLTRERLTRWVELADGRRFGRSRRIIINAGNDDPEYVDEVLDQSKTIERPEGRVLELGGHIEMISTGFANQTPWNCPRDVTEEQLRTRIDDAAARVHDPSRCIFNLHCPPFGSLLDRARVVNAFGEQFKSVGSTAVRDAIRHYQPAVGLHGHIHESRAAEAIGRTRCFNPGSTYREGRLLGVLLEFNRGQLRSAVWTPRLEPIFLS
jgi:Icc-related predicted phosphoesterase